MKPDSGSLSADTGKEGLKREGGGARKEQDTLWGSRRLLLVSIAESMQCETFSAQ